MAAPALIALCKTCRRPVRDCTTFRAGGGWYHTETGRERCEGTKAMAAPLPLIAAICPYHQARYHPQCGMCQIALPVMIGLHNDNRCIPLICGCAMFGR
jgi:hypothetical protein